ncbi:hypothetical protein CA13_67580 [Planctomycetes bacterium CA13]|uniref:Uncharacterized protein n=1 Tax=Novipirellula herctigrandis TaxID=2527986 RepID=A0A5C5YN12_9BACT|nr:hypothetical protein CA13_67580 [Planctomycetes bacterium CA13]
MRCSFMIARQPFLWQVMKFLWQVMRFLWQVMRFLWQMMKECANRSQPVSRFRINTSHKTPQLVPSAHEVRAIRASAVFF